MRNILSILLAMFIGISVVGCKEQERSLRDMTWLGANIKAKNSETIYEKFGEVLRSKGFILIGQTPTFQVYANDNYIVDKKIYRVTLILDKSNEVKDGEMIFFSLVKIEKYIDGSGLFDCYLYEDGCWEVFLKLHNFFHSFADRNDRGEIQ